MLIQATTYVLGDEKAIALSEMHKQIPSKPGYRRYQIIKVVRDDKEAIYTEDLGSVNKFKGIAPIYIPSLMEHTVNELRQMANEMRAEQQFDLKELSHYQLQGLI